MRTIARWLTEQWFNLGIVQAHVADADRAAELAKCDLVTEMVKEFTELQGVVGGLYAGRRANRKIVADAVYDHYRPVGLDDPIPRNITGCAVALADKLDSIVGCFSRGRCPDRFERSLRAASRGTGHRQDYSGAQVAGVAVAGHRRGRKGAATRMPPKKHLTPAQETQVLEFILDRAKFVLREKSGYAYDEVNAVFRAGSDDLVEVEKRLKALKAIRKSKNFEPLAVSFKRIRKILEKANLPADAPHDERETFEKDAERELYAAVRKAAAKVSEDKRAGKYHEALDEDRRVAQGGRSVFYRRDGDGGGRSGAEEPAGAAGGDCCGSSRRSRTSRNWVAKREGSCRR